jgi:hypothetical protein
MKTLSRIALLVSLAFVVDGKTQAAQIIGVKMDDHAKVGNSSLTLNGLGVRKFSVVLGITVNVYVAGLYVEKPSKDAGEILNAPGPKLLRMHFTHEISKESFRKAWSESFEKNCPSGPACEAQKAQLKQLNDLMVDVNEDDIMDCVFLKDKTQITVRGKLLGEIAGAEFEKTLLKAWIGEPPNPELKAGLLGTGPGV